MQLFRGQSANEGAFGKGNAVDIVGGVYRQYRYAGVIAGETRCFVDVFVPQLQRELRVRKTSVRRAIPTKPMESESEDHSQRGSKWCEKGGEDAPQAVLDLVAVCVRMVKLGLVEGDADVHAMVDAGLRAAREQQHNEGDE
jgi:hypothetical protein